MVVLKKNVFTVVEIGSSKIISIIFSINQKEIKILGFSICNSIGIKNGVIINMREAINSIARSVEKAEQSYGKNIEEVYISLSGIDIFSEIITQDVNINGRDVNERDLKNLTNKANETLQANYDQITIHSINNGYALDDIYVSYPIGMYANKLSVSTNFISCSRIPLININQVFANCRLSIKNHLCALYMESFSCLSEDDKNIGASIISFGSNSTSLITFKNGCLVSCLSINMGSSLLTFDIAHAFGISLFEAEKLKIEYGSLYDIRNDNYCENIILVKENKNFENNNSGENYHIINDLPNKKEINENNILINKYDFLSVILARQEEIIDTLISKAKSLGQIFSDRKLILTGGGAKINGLIDMIKEFIPSRNIRIYEYQDDISIINDFNEFDLNDQIFSSIIGSIKYIHNLYYKDIDFDLSKISSSRSRNIFKRFANLINVFN